MVLPTPNTLDTRSVPDVAPDSPPAKKAAIDAPKGAKAKRVAASVSESSSSESDSDSSDSTDTEDKPASSKPAHKAAKKDSPVKADDNISEDTDEEINREAAKLKAKAAVGKPQPSNEQDKGAGSSPNAKTEEYRVIGSRKGSRKLKDKKEADVDPDIPPIEMEVPIPIKRKEVLNEASDAKFTGLVVRTACDL